MARHTSEMYVLTKQKQWPYQRNNDVRARVIKIYICTYTFSIISLWTNIKNRTGHNWCSNMDKADGCCLVALSFCLLPMVGYWPKCPGLCNELCARAHRVKHTFARRHITRQQVIWANVFGQLITVLVAIYLTLNLPLESACTFDTWIYSQHTHTHTWPKTIVDFFSHLRLELLSLFSSAFRLFSFILPFIYAVQFDKWSIFEKEPPPASASTSTTRTTR